MEDETSVVPETPNQALYTVYTSAAEIPYVPENALKEGLCMVDTIKNSLKTLKLGSKLRQDVWSREIERCVSSLFTLRLNDDTSVPFQPPKPRRTDYAYCCMWWYVICLLD
jgi:hypothetical protein